jgi:hypothetical protein
MNRRPLLARRMAAEAAGTFASLGHLSGAHLPDWPPRGVLLGVAGPLERDAGAK